MPFLPNPPRNQSTIQPGRIGTLRASVEPDAAERPAFFDETLPAAFRTENTIGAILSREEGAPAWYNRQRIDTDFDPFDGIAGSDYERSADAFAFANNADDVAALKRQIDRENADRETIGRAGAAGFAAMMAAGVIEPINLIPVGGVAYRSYSLGRSVLDGGINGVRAGLLSSTAAEAVLFSEQETRTVGEAGLNIAVGTFLGGILGGAGGAVRRGIEKARLGKIHDNARTLDADGNVGGDRSVEVALNDLEDGLSTIKFDEGRGAIRADGSADLQTNFGMVKVVWKHGVESPKAQGKNAGWNAVTRDDVTAFPDIVRNFDALPAVGQSNAPKWRWVVERPGADGTPRNVVYSVTRFTEGDAADHVVTLHVIGKGGDLSPRRAGGLGDTIRGMFGADAKTRPASASPATDDGAAGIPTGGRLIPTPGGRTPDASEGNIAKRGDGVTLPDDIAVRLNDDLTLPADGAPDPLIPGEYDLDDIARPTGDGGSVGAAASNNNTLTEEGLKSALGVEKAIKFQDPMLRTLTGPSIAARRTMQSLAENPMALEKNVRGAATPNAVETKIKRYQAGVYRAVIAMDQAFVKYRKGREGRIGDIAAIGAADLTGQAGRQGKLTYRAFREEISRAMRRGDIHDINEVAIAARAWRREVFDPLKDQAIKAELLPEDVDVDTATSYLQRIYNPEKIVQNRNDFEKTVTDWLVSEAELAGRRAFDDEATLADLNALLRADRAEARRLRTTQARDERELMRDRARLSEAQAATRTRETDVNQARRRADDLAVSEDLPADDDIQGLLRDIRRGSPAREAQRLSVWLRAQGGLIDQGGELKNMGITAKETPGLVNNKSGMNLDDATFKAWEQGFMSDFAERPDIEDFLAVLRGDVDDFVPVVRDEDLELQAYANDIRNIRAELEAKDIDVDKLNARELDEVLQTGEAPTSRRATPMTRLRERSARQAEARLMKRLNSSDVRTVKAEAELDEIIERLVRARAQRSTVRNTAERFESRINEVTKMRAELTKRRHQDLYRAGFDRLELQDVAEQITDRILGTPDGRLPYDTAVGDVRPRRGGRADVSGPLKGRSFKIPDEMIEPYLENDIEMIGRIYTRSMSADVELVKAFGSVDMLDQIENVRRDFARMSREAKSAAERQKIQKQRDAAIRDIAGVRDRVRGVYALPQDPDSVFVRGVKVVKSLNYLRLLGGMTLSALPDPVRPVMVHGLMPVLQDGLLPMIRNFKGYRLATEEIKLAGTALDMVLDSRTMAIADVMDDFGRHSKFERAIQSMTNNFGVVSLMAPWNAAVKQFTGVVTMTNMLKAAARVRAGRATAKDLEKLAASGIDRLMARKIADQFSAHGVTDRGVRMANTRAWTDGDAVDAVRNAILRDVDRTIVTPGQDKPLWMSTVLGSAIGQFKSFQFASTQRVMLSGLQQRDLAALTGLVGMVGVGMLSYYLKTKLAGRDVSDDPRKWIVEGVDRAGVTGWLFEANNMIEKLTRGSVGVGAVIGAQPMSRFASRSVPEAILGPSLGTMINLSLATGAIATGDISKSDVSAFRRLLPYQNLFYLRGILDEAEASIAAKLGARK